MIKETLIQELQELISALASQENLELIDLISKYDGNNLILSVLVDKLQGDGLASFGQSHKLKGGITAGECALFNRRLGGLLEEKNIIEGNYILEVASPGLDRCLKTVKDFARCVNKEAVFFLNDLVNGKSQWQGLISKVSQESVFINVFGQMLEVPLIKINKAQLVIQERIGE